jgi:NAD(P)-dependent dehydrogenase (short-subunit alcohol dehydrogenase family)
MHISFTNQVALVTGAASGLGLATARAFAEAGASVALADWHEDAVREAADALAHEGHKTLAIRCDVPDDRQVEAMVAATRRRWTQEMAIGARSAPRPSSTSPPFRTNNSHQFNRLRG